MGSFNKTVEWIQGHKDRDDIIAKAGFKKNEFYHTNVRFKKPDQNFVKLDSVKNQMIEEKKRIMDSKRTLMEIN